MSTSLFHFFDIVIDLTRQQGRFRTTVRQYLLRSIAGGVFGTAACVGAFANVGCTNASPNTILEQSREASAYVFIARVTALTWYDAYASTASSERGEYASGVVKATYVIQDVIKGGPPPFVTIDQTVYGHGDRPTLKVATDYVFMLNNSEAFDWWGPKCLKTFQEINWNGGAEGWSRRIRSIHPDQIGSPPLITPN